MKKLELKLYGDPDVDVREAKQNDTKDEIEDKLKFPFLAQKVAVLKIKYGQEKYCFSNPAPKKYDGATIPFGLCKGDIRLLTPALFHDLMCEDKSLIGYNRFLSSLIYFKLLLLYKVNPIWALIQFLCVEWYQRKQNWQRGDKEKK